VARADSPKQQVRSALARLQYARAKILGLVLNKTGDSGGTRYHYQYYASEPRGVDAPFTDEGGARTGSKFGQPPFSSSSEGSSGQFSAQAGSIAKRIRNLSSIRGISRKRDNAEPKTDSAASVYSENQQAAPDAEPIAKAFKEPEPANPEAATGFESADMREPEPDAGTGAPSEYEAMLPNEQSGAGIEPQPRTESSPPASSETELIDDSEVSGPAALQAPEESPSAEMIAAEDREIDAFVNDAPNPPALEEDHPSAQGEPPTVMEAEAESTSRAVEGTTVEDAGGETAWISSTHSPLEESAMPEEQVRSQPTSHIDGLARTTMREADGIVFEITKESRFSGQLKFAGTVVVQGEIEGELEAARVIIRESGVANARISGETVVIAGRVTGDVLARRDLEMSSSGKLSGSATAPQMRLAPGAMFRGQCTIGG
jgi:cytoskeletal protein CcmA (bactofilin family)